MVRTKISARSASRACHTEKGETIKSRSACTSTGHIIRTGDRIGYKALVPKCATKTRPQSSQAGKAWGHNVTTDK